MNACSYCGRENDDSASRCSGCGTELTRVPVPSSTPPPLPPPPPPQPESVNLDTLDGAFTIRNGFSRPEWPVILKALRENTFNVARHLSPSLSSARSGGEGARRAGEEALRDFTSHAARAKAAAWSEVLSQWLNRWKTELGEGFEWVHSGSCSLLSKLDRDAAGRTLQKANWIAAALGRAAGPVAWEGSPRLVLIHIDDTDKATQFYEAEQSEQSSDPIPAAARAQTPCWLLLSEPVEARLGQELETALVWSCLSHLRLPAWLSLGVQTQLRHALAAARMGQAHPLQNLDLVPNHRRFWFEDTIQTFWAGTTPQEYPEYRDLYYELCDLLVFFLSERAKSLTDFLRLASELDAGQTAASVLLKIDLGELAATFLGPGQWAPDPLAMAECWARIDKIASADLEA